MQTINGEPAWTEEPADHGVNLFAVRGELTQARGERLARGSSPSLYSIFCDPFNTAGLIIDTTMHRGFTIEVHDLIEHRRIFFGCAEDLYDLLVFIGTPSRSVIKHVFRREHMQEPVASTSQSRLSLIAARYVGKGDPIMIVRCQSDLPAAGEVLEPFARPHLVAGGCAPSWPSMTRSASSSPRVSSMTSMQRVARSRTWITPQRHHGSARPASGAAAGRCVSRSANDALRPPGLRGLPGLSGLARKGREVRQATPPCRRGVGGRVARSVRHLLRGDGIDRFIQPASFGNARHFVPS